MSVLGTIALTLIRKAMPLPLNLIHLVWILLSKLTVFNAVPSITVSFVHTLHTKLTGLYEL